MIDQMKVGVSWNIQGDALTKTKKFQESVTALNKALTGIPAKLKEFSDAILKFDAEIGKLSPKLIQFMDDAKGAASGIRTVNSAARASAKAFQGYQITIDGARIRTNDLAHSVVNLNSKLAETVVSARMAGYGFGGRTSGGSNSNKSSSSSDTPKGYLGANGLWYPEEAAVASTVSRRHGGLHRLLGAKNGETGTMALGAMAGGVFGMPALLTAYMGYKGFEANSEFQQAVAQYSQQGFGASATQQAVNFAKNTPIAGVSKIELMHAITDAITVTRSPASALALAPSVAKMEFANQQIYTQQGKSFTRQDEMRMLQFAELRSGTTDPGVFLKTLNLIEQGYASDAARLNTNDIRTFGRQGASFIHNLSDKDFAGLLPLIQSEGGQRTATGLTTMQTSLFKGQNMRTGKRAAAEFGRLGIFKNGKLDPKYSDQLTHSPLDFIYNTLLPAMSSKGIKTEGQISQELSVLFTQSTVRVIQQAIAQMPRVLAQEALVPKAGAIGSNYLASLNLPAGQAAQVAASFKNVALAFGELQGPLVSAGMKSLTIFLNILAATFDTVSKVGVGIGTGAGAIAGGIGSIFKPIDKAKAFLGGSIDEFVHKSAANSDAEQKKAHAASAGGGSGGVINLQVKGRTIATMQQDDLVQQLNRSQYSKSTFDPSQNPVTPGSTFLY